MRTSDLDLTSRAIRRKENSNKSEWLQVIWHESSQKKIQDFAHESPESYNSLQFEKKKHVV